MVISLYQQSAGLPREFFRWILVHLGWTHQLIPSSRNASGSSPFSATERALTSSRRLRMLFFFAPGVFLFWFHLWWLDDVWDTGCKLTALFWPPFHELTTNNMCVPITPPETKCRMPHEKIPSQEEMSSSNRWFSVLVAGRVYSSIC